MRLCQARICHPARRMPRRPRPATELTSNQMPARSAEVPRAVTRPTGLALSFFLISLGPLANSPDACGALCDGALAAARAAADEVSEAVPGEESDDMAEVDDSEPLLDEPDDEVESEPVKPAEPSVLPEEPDDPELLPLSLLLPLPEALPSVWPSLADWVSVSPKM